MTTAFVFFKLYVNIFAGRLLFEAGNGTFSFPLIVLIVTLLPKRSVVGLEMFFTHLVLTRLHIRHTVLVRLLQVLLSEAGRTSTLYFLQLDGVLQ